MALSLVLGGMVILLDVWCFRTFGQQQISCLIQEVKPIPCPECEPSSCVCQQDLDSNWPFCNATDAPNGICRQPGQCCLAQQCEWCPPLPTPPLATTPHTSYYACNCQCTQFGVTECAKTCNDATCYNITAQICSPSDTHNANCLLVHFVQECSTQDLTCQHETEKGLGQLGPCPQIKHSPFAKVGILWIFMSPSILFLLGFYACWPRHSKIQMRNIENYGTL